MSEGLNYAVMQVYVEGRMVAEARSSHEHSAYLALDATPVPVRTELLAQLLEDIPTLKTYQKVVDHTAIYPGKGTGQLWYTLFGAVDEACEALCKYASAGLKTGKVSDNALVYNAALMAASIGRVLGLLKKAHRDDGGRIADERRRRLNHEITLLHDRIFDLDDAIDEADAVRFEPLPLDAELRAELAAELGDAFWYPAASLNEAGLDGNAVLQGNAAKLLNRMRRDKLKGDGDDR